MDMHRAFHVAENLMFDPSLDGLDYVGIGYDRDLVQPGSDPAEGYFVELFNEMNDDRSKADFRIINEEDVAKFYDSMNESHGAV